MNALIYGVRDRPENMNYGARFRCALINALMYGLFFTYIDMAL